MSTIFALAGLNVSDYQYARQAGQQILYDATKQYLDRENALMMSAMDAFVQPGTTDLYSERVKTPGSGVTLQLMGSQARPAAQRAYGGYDVAYPLFEYGGALAENDEDMRYMSPQEYQLHVDSVITAYAHTMRREVLRALMYGSNATFVDKRNGALTIRRLANTDGTAYPPAIGSTSEADAQHYLYSGYAATDISDVNNPFPTMIAKLQAYYGNPTGGANIVAYIHSDQTAKVRALTEFVPVEDMYISVGDSTTTPINLPQAPATARVLGRLQDTGCWVIEWVYMPTGYIYMQHTGEDKPLKMRVDPAGTGYGMGLQLAAQDENFPLSSSIWRLRFGFGVRNRLNGVAMFLDASGPYTDPVIA